MKHTITKAVILCGGYGTRMLPYTKSHPKEMLPILTTPALQLIIEQAIDAGIKEFFIVISPNKESIVNHLKDMFPAVKIFYGLQNKMEGTGPATMVAKDFIGREPFLLIYPDELVLEQNLYQTLINDFNQNQSSCLSAYKIPLSDAKKYGILIPDGKNRTKGIVEKPQGTPPSNLASLGTCVLVPEILDLIGEHSADGHEVFLTDAISKLPNLRYVEITGKRFDLGNPLGLAKANAYVAMQKLPDFKIWLKENI